MCSLFCVFVCRYGDCLVLVGGQEQREQVLCPQNLDPAIVSRLTIKKYAMLELAGACRGDGVARSFVTKHFLKIDAGRVFHVTKTLQMNGLVVIKVRGVVKGVVSNVRGVVRFS